MSLSIEKESAPLVFDAQGVVRIGNTRVTLDTVVGTFETGASAEEIAQQYPTLDLVDIYSVIAFFLRHREAVTSYLQQRKKLAEPERQAARTNQNQMQIRDRLLRRRQEPCP